MKFKKGAGFMVTYQNVYEEIAAKIGALSVEQLLSLQDAITARLREELGSLAATNGTVAKPKTFIVPGSDQPTQVSPETEQLMLQILTPEEWAQVKSDMENGVPLELPEVAESISQYVIEDRSR
jgi:hypothetical protein